MISLEEKARLSKEVQELESHLEKLKERVGLTGDRGLEKVAASNVVLGSVLRQQQLLVAKAQAGLAACLRSPAPSPLYSYIHLGVDQDLRSRTLESIREFKIQNGIDYIEARSRYLDLLQPHTSSEQFVDTQGDFCYAFFDVVQFDGVKSVRDVYDAAMFFFMNEEISISERLGYITVRDDFDRAGDKFSNSRLTSANENGVKTETNCASFAQFVESNDSQSNEPFGILVRDNVDVDDLYPYSPNECVRKDYLGSILLTAVARKKEGEELVNAEKHPDICKGACGIEEEELVVIMRRSAYVKINHPPFPLPPGTQQGLIQGVLAWSDITLSTIRNLLATNSCPRSAV
ncbi:hypothetical protein BBO99_00008692 [Phytophthora kernoviae]|uniref:Uncharacterized protein n=1 Tax=Phytophthora kernoviae TaxID=325452 RepID=A0A3R7GTP7_9STRA|nr:hypothetical protein BBI17_008667 [Phytophthora kernoviae]RLN74870.1 hypothetical protein BBO99_00008692 [Phytophthora kernoviae]